MGTRFNEDRKGRIAIRKNKLQISKKYKYYFSLFVSIIFLQRASPGEMAEELKKILQISPSPIGTKIWASASKRSLLNP